MLDVNKIREDFPILNREIHGKKLIYLDNTATTHKPKQVIEAIKSFYEVYNANIHRGLHTLSQEASKMYEEAHDKVAEFIGADGREEIVFVRNSTEGLNLVAYAWGLKNLGEGDEIVTTLMEHHSNIVPWELVASIKKATVKYVPVKKDGTLNIEAMAEAITPRTKVVTVTHISNVLGTINDVREVGKLAREVDAIFVVDGAQSVPHMPIDVKALGCDFLAFSGHKMLGPTGMGCLYGRRELLEEMPPFLGGGDMIKSVGYDAKTGRCVCEWNMLPWKYEAGTPNIAGGIGLAAAVEYLQKIGMENVRQHERMLIEYTLKRVVDELSDITIYGPMDAEIRAGIFTFNVGDMNPHEVSLYLDKEWGIATRSGFHCAEPLHMLMGATKGTARASYYIYNTTEEIDVLVEALSKIPKKG